MSLSLREVTITKYTLNHRKKSHKIIT